MDKRHITLIIPFFGPPPVWLPFFLKSCYANPGVSFLFLADRLAQGTTGNVRVVAMTLEEMRQRAEQKLQMPVALQSPYKICDLRPAFGLLFEEYLRDSLFWGTCDTDIIFGDIRRFITDDVLDSHDVITAKREYLIGHFTLYRNTPFVNHLFRQSAHYRDVFQSPRAFAFDECNFLWWKLLAGQDVLETPSQVESMTYIVKKLEAKGQLRAYFHSHVIEQDVLLPDGSLQPLEKRLVWRQGVLSDETDDTEYLSFHFHFLKKDPAFVIPVMQQVPDVFQVSQTGFSTTALYSTEQLCTLTI